MNQTHSKIGASTCERWWNCPGSVREIAKLPEQPPSEYALEGTRAHELAELCLRKKQDPFILAIDENMANAIQLYIDVICDDMVQYPQAKLQIEHKFHLVSVDQNAFGTNDANLRQFMGRLIVYDFKYGAGVAVEAEENKQMLYYALGAAQEGDFTEIELVIVQPRAMHKDGPVRRWLITIEQLEQFSVELKSAIEATKDSNAELKAGSWCHKTFCPYLSQCPAVKKNIQKSADLVFDEINEDNLPAPEKMTPLQLRRLLDVIPLIDAWIKAVEGHAFNLANSGKHIPDYKLVRKRANRKWSDTAEDQLKKMFKQDVIYDLKLKSPAQLEKLVDKKVVAPLTITPDAGLVLVHESDPREEVSAQAIDVFDKIQ